MDFAVGKVVKATQVYQNQSRIGDLNRKSNLKTVQGQLDRVDLSASAQRLLERAQADPFSQVLQFLEAGPSRTENPKPPQPSRPIGPVLESAEFQPLDFSQTAGAESLSEDQL